MSTNWPWHDIATLPNDDRLVLAHCPPDETFPEGRTMIWRASILFDQFARIKKGIPQPSHLSFPATLWAEVPAPGAAEGSEAETTAPITDVPVVAWRYASSNGDGTYSIHTDELRSEPPEYEGYKPVGFVRQSDHLAAVEKLTRERDEARDTIAMMEVAERETVSWLARAKSAEAELAKAKSALRAARTTLNSVVALDDEDAVEGSDLSASCQEVVQRIDAALAKIGSGK